MKTAATFLLFYLVLWSGGTAWHSVPVSQFIYAPPVRADVMVTGVEVSGEEGAYTFHVRLKSDDRGCSQYADWWEVIRPDGSLRYRRILAHSHVDEQPFTRSGGPVPIRKDETVYIRGHMNTTGYGDKAYRGSVQKGFVPATVSADFSAALEHSPPLPEGCAF